MKYHQEAANKCEWKKEKDFVSGVVGGKAIEE